MPEQVDAVVVGAGVVGLAVARALALRGREVLVLEAERATGTGISSRNSEVIHGGLYYPPGSLKGRLCVQGNRLLYDYCARNGVAHRRCGKLVVAATAPQMEQVRAIAATGAAHGMDGLALLDAAAVRALEPELCCAGALHSANTGIVDTHGLMLALQGDLEQAGGMVVLASPVAGGRVVPGGIELDIGGGAPMTLQARLVVNCAGLHAQAVARSLAGFAPAAVPALHYAKGNYFSLAGKSPFTRLVYPVPESAGLGVHMTLDLAGRARFGPDVEWIDRLDYRVDPQRAAAFQEAIRRYWPGLPDDALQPDYAGIRPKLQAPGEPARDFLIAGPAAHGVAGLVHLFGIESPGLTASLAIGEHVGAMSIDATR